MPAATRASCDEFEEILNPLGYTVVFQKDVVGPLEVEETGDTFEENALLKAQAVFDRCGKMVISDDSGVVVDALGRRAGRPHCPLCRAGGGQ